MIPQTIRWTGGVLCILDQTRLPGEVVEIALPTLAAVWEAIRALRVRGAPAIGICAAFGVVVALREHNPDTLDRARVVLRDADRHLRESRPTAVNLFWALDRMQRAAARCDAQSPAGLMACLEAEACDLLDEDRSACAAIGHHGAPLIHDGMGVLTHCNAGALAASAHGTALSVLYAAHDAGRRFHVYADETRPLLQGARLTAWELMRAGIDVTLICDNMAAQVMKEGRIDIVVVGADRITANGDTANKIGTYGVALLAKAHGIPFYVAAPSSTIDCSLSHGDLIPIEQRASEEVTEAFGCRTAPEGVHVYNPAFDVTPAQLIAGYITESGLLQAPFSWDSLAGCAEALAHGMEA
jgi:methylthioribose-1-phosphate isomerase